MKLISKLYFFFWYKHHCRIMHKIVQRYLYNARPEKVMRFKNLIIKQLEENTYEGN